MAKHFVNACIFFPKSIYSNKDGGLITVCNAVYSAGYHEMGSKLISDCISLNYTMNKMQHALYQFHWGPWMLCLSMHRMKSEYFKIWSRGTKWPAGTIWVLHLFAGFHLWYYLVYPTDRSRQLSWTPSWKQPELHSLVRPPSPQSCMWSHNSLQSVGKNLPWIVITMSLLTEKSVNKYAIYSLELL